MEKFKMEKFGKTSYLLGTDKNGMKYFLESAQWDCDWYWSGGYIVTYTNNYHPEAANDIASHEHFDELFFGTSVNGFDAFNEFFAETPFSEGEIWTICELMKSFYVCRKYSDLIHRGGAHYAANPVAEFIKNDKEYTRINQVVIPAIMEKLYSILEP